MSLDRIDLWDLRPTDSISGPNNRFDWVKQQLRDGNYQAVQRKYDVPYDRDPAPSKIPGGALEFPLSAVGTPDSVTLSFADAVCRIMWGDTMSLTTFIHPDIPVGWFRITGAPADFTPVICPPNYASASSVDDNSHAGDDLSRLGYTQGDVTHRQNGMHYRQHGWDGFLYDIDVEWNRQNDTLYGVWSITSSLAADDAAQLTAGALKRGFEADSADLARFCDSYWAQSSIAIPDSVLQWQYDSEMYKFSAVARENSYPISLQAVWTADNGRLPPWKGDYHHDLNTQLSYWHAYTGNHLTEQLGYLNTLWNQRDVYKRYTRQYFETDGMNVPGVCTLTGEPMGGWIQYSMSQTAGAWLAHHFYLHWKYSADKDFLLSRAYPFITDVATFLEQISHIDSDGMRRLEYSSSPEIFDNSAKAWFTDMTNYDLSLMKSLFAAATEVAAAAGKPDESGHWREIGSQLPPFDLDSLGALTFAHGVPYNESHRHFSHAMAIHPLGIIDVANGTADSLIVEATLNALVDNGPDYWTGYSYAWLGNMMARAAKGNEAAKALRTFADCFCSTNTFHLNGDQTASGKSRFTYRPFTLEGNFAFAAGILEMLLQSHTGIINVFPALPDDWTDASFHQLRAQGGVLVNARLQNSQLTQLQLMSSTDTTVTVKSPYLPHPITVHLTPGEWVTPDIPANP